MGVHGLTTYLTDNRRALATSLQFPSRTKSSLTPIVVDGWSFIYDLHHYSNLSWVYGGEYEVFSKLVMSVVRAWISVGLKVFFVFDGAYPRIKFTTLTTRLLRSYINPSLLFFRTSHVSRATPRFLSEARIIPPLVYAACMHALRTVAIDTNALEIHLADEEGDPHAVELAGRIGGYVVGRDSDYAILNADGYLGYIPLTEMIWTGRLQDEEAVSQNEDDFQVVKKPKGKKKPVQNYPTLGRGVILPDVTSDLTLSLVYYHPSALASHLNLPVSLLPLLGAFVGNDYVNQSSPRRNIQSMFFDRQLTPSQRISQVASTLQLILSTSSQKRKKQQIGSVMDLVERTVNTLLTRSVSTLGSGEMKTIVDGIVEATMQYVLPKCNSEVGEDGLWPTAICALHDPEVCPVLPFFSRLLAAEALSAGEESKEVAQRDMIRGLYLTAYREGRLSPRLINILNTGTYWPRLFLENPDLETVSLSIGRRIREWCYSILESALGLPDTEAEVRSEADESKVEEDEEDEDELIDVIEEDSDENPLAPLRDELKNLHVTDGKGTEPGESTSSQPQSLPTPQFKSITEYVRRGSRVADDVVLVPPLCDLLGSIPDFDSHHIPLQLWPEEDRLTVLLHVVESNTLLVRALPREHLMAVLALRWVTRIVHLRVQDSTEKGKESWTKHEAQSFLASFSWPETNTFLPAAVTPSENPPIDDRNISLMAQALMALESVEHLSQVLLLSDRLPTPAHLLSGKTCHSYWTSQNPLNPAIIPFGLWDACEDGLEDVFADDKRSMKKGKKAKMNTSPTIVKSGGAEGPKGIFGVLANLED